MDDKSSPEATRSKNAQAAYEEGLREGVRLGRRDILDFLEREYLADDNRPDRGSEHARAILDVARKAAAHLKDLPAPEGLTQK